MKILQILPEMNVGGVETGTLDFAKYLVREGHESIVVSNGGSLVFELQKSGTRHYKLPVHKKSLWPACKMIGILVKIIREENVDIVHARSRVPAWIAFFACKRTKAILITTCHGYYSNHFFSSVMGWGRLVIIPSKAIGRHMIKDFKIPQANIRVIPRSVDLRKFKLSTKENLKKSRCTISIIGRITPLKGHVYFLRAMADVIRSVPYAKIWIIGSPPLGKESYLRELHVLIRRLGLTDYVEFLGNQRDIPKLLQEIDVLVMSTTTQEAFGRVILEAQAAEVPVVATRVGGVVDIIDDGQTGLLVPPKDTRSMAQAVVRILNDPGLVKRITSQALKKLKSNFTLEHMASQTIKVYEEALSSLNILVIKLSSLGDVVLITASLRAIREKYPKAKVFCLVGRESRKILQRCPYLDGLIICDPRDKDKSLIGILKLSRGLNKYKFDKIIDFQNSHRSHLLAFFSFPQESYGYDNGKFGFLLSNRIKDGRREISPVEHQFLILKKLGIRFKKDYFLEVWSSQHDEEYIRQLLDSEWVGKKCHVVGINISASERWETKNWPIDHIASLCDILSSQNIRVIITGTKRERPLVKQLTKLTRAKPAIFIGKTDVLQLAALIKRCQVYITPDSAPMHLAAAVGTPFIAFFGPTDPVRHLPPARKFTIFRKELNCTPCYSTACLIRTHACMDQITPQEVALKVIEFMELKK